MDSAQIVSASPTVVTDTNSVTTGEPSTSSTSSLPDGTNSQLSSAPPAVLEHDAAQDIADALASLTPGASSASVVASVLPSPTQPSSVDSTPISLVSPLPAPPVESPTTSPSSIAEEVSTIVAPTTPVSEASSSQSAQGVSQSASSTTPATLPQSVPPTVSAKKTESAPANNVLDQLLQEKSITQEQYDTITLEHVNTGKPVDRILEEKQTVSEEVLTKARARVFNIPFIGIKEVGVSPQALSMVQDGIAKKYTLLPFALNAQSNSISIAMKDPLDLSTIDFLEKKTGMRVVAYYATPHDLEQAILERYAQSLSTEVTAALKESSTDKNTGVTIKSVNARNLGDTIREAPIAKIVETILSFAVKARASDVHIEPQEDKTRVRYRIDGILHEKLILPKSVQDAVISRIKVLSDLKIDEKRVPQDGRFTFRIDKEEVDLRISTLPTVHGEKIVMRLLKKTGGVPSLHELGLRGNALKNLEAAAIVPHGIVLVTGPTGSGKTTTLYSLLHKINTPKVNIVTLEDPVEYQMIGINQVQTNPQAGLTFASGLRAFLRQDPNIIMVGEVRDQETAELAIQASLTGHLVFSTLHTNSAAGALPRLLDMHAEPFLLISSMTLVMAQRVVRCVCEQCKEQYDPEPKVVEDIEKVLGPLFDGWKQEHKEKLMLYRGKGCEECGGTGYQGRVGIFEVLVMTEKIGKLVLERKPASEIERQGLEDGMMLMKQDGYMKALEGITTIEEVLRVAQV
jgi:type IV pilus assembly protein PilB